MSALPKILVIAMMIFWSDAAVPFMRGPTDDAKSEVEIRQALAGWVNAINRQDHETASKIWAPNVIGWFPSAPEFSKDEASAVAGLSKEQSQSSTYELKIDEVSVSGSLAAVHDIWTETAHFKGSTVTVQRMIRGSELWKLQPDGKWKIARWVSAPEKWQR